MKSTELRIGNYISLVDGRDVIVTGITNNKVLDGIFTLIHHNEGSHIPEHTLAIPITEEWLVKLVGKKVIDGNIYKEWDIQGVCFEFTKSGFYYTAGEGINLSTNINYVHQLQNIYFTLTGNELTIK